MKNDPSHSAFRAKLRACVAEEIDAHWRQLDGGQCRNLRALVMNAAEEELLDFAMRRANYNQKNAALILGISRATLSRKLLSSSHPTPNARPNSTAHANAHARPNSNAKAHPVAKMKRAGGISIADKKEAP